MSTAVRDAIRAALSAYDADRRTCRPALVRALELAQAEVTDPLETPLRPPSSADMRAAHQSSSNFRAADVMRILEEGKK